MFISVLELFKIGVGPSSSHTMGPMVAASAFLQRINAAADLLKKQTPLQLQCVLKGSLAHTGKGHHTDKAVLLGMHGYTPAQLAEIDVAALIDQLWKTNVLEPIGSLTIGFDAAQDIVFDQGEPLAEHPNGMIFKLLNSSAKVILEETYFSIGGGFVDTLAEITELVAPLKMTVDSSYPYPFESAAQMIAMAEQSGLSVAAMKRANESRRMSESELHAGLDAVWNAMSRCIDNGLSATGVLPGGLGLPRRAGQLNKTLQSQGLAASLNDWLCAYAMAVNEENAAGHLVVTAPTNGAAGVIAAVLSYLVRHEHGTQEQVREFLLTAGAIGGIIKYRSSISGAEVGCQGEVGSAAAMAAAGLCAVRGGTVRQIENAAEIALEHHLGMTCDPVNGLVQVPCIERNGFGAIKAHTAASLAMHGSGEHFMPLDKCIAAMKRTGEDMSHKYKETSLGGLAVSVTEC